MKKIYLKPLSEITLYNVKTAMLAGSGTQGSIIDDDHNQDPLTGDVTPTDDDIPSTAKGGDFFEESISPSSSSIWGDED